MDGSLMFIIYPSSTNSVIVSIRTANGHDTPNVIAEPNVFLHSSHITNGLMTANVVCYNCTGWTGGKGLDIQSNEQPWIWATGPGQQQGSSDKRSVIQDAEIEKHKQYGELFRWDIPKFELMVAQAPFSLTCQKHCRQPP
jgi:hypothetical protein